jgi:hypothetical protein
VFLSALKNIKFMSGTEVTVTFTITGTIKRVVTGLGYPPTGFIILAGHTFNDLAQNAIPATEVDKTVLYLSAGSVGTYTIWVF